MHTRVSFLAPAEGTVGLPISAALGIVAFKGMCSDGVPLLGPIWKPPGLAQRETSFIPVLFSTSTQCTSYLNSFLKPKKPHYCLQWFIITWSLLKYFGLYTTINFAPLFHLDKKAFLAWQRARAYTEPKETLWSRGVPLVLFLQRLHISFSGIHRRFRWQNTTPLTNVSCEAHIFYTPVSTTVFVLLLPALPFPWHNQNTYCWVTKASGCAVHDPI